MLFMVAAQPEPSIAEMKERQRQG